MATKLHEVFGIAQQVSQASYVDRGRLDERMRYLLGTDRHIAIHGDSKQGKSWLRNSVLDADETLVVQCLVNTTPEALFNEALGMQHVRRAPVFGHPGCRRVAADDSGDVARGERPRRLAGAE